MGGGAPGIISGGAIPGMTGGYDIIEAPPIISIRGFLDGGSSNLPENKDLAVNSAMEGHRVDTCSVLGENSGIKPSWKSRGLRAFLNAITPCYSALYMYM